MRSQRFCSSAGVERWYKAAGYIGSTNLSGPPYRHRTIRTKGAIQKTKHRLERQKPVPSRKSGHELGISRANIEKNTQKGPRTASL